MGNLKFYTQSGLVEFSPTICNGNGAYAGAPALVEHADFPMSNLLLKPRYKPWRRGGAGTSGSLELHIDLGLARSQRGFAICMHRQYVPGAGGITNVDYYVGPGSSYPPVWTLKASMAMTPEDNDKLVDLGAFITNRWMRFVFTYTGDFSCKLWSLLTSGSSIDMGLEYGGGTTTSIERALSERATILGVPLLYDVGVGPNTTRRRWVLKGLWTSTTFAVLRNTLRERQSSFLLRDVDGKYFEANVVGNDFEWHRLITGLSGGLHEASLELEQMP
jgi:hypothetical protein